MLYAWYQQGNCSECPDNHVHVIYHRAPKTTLMNDILPATVAFGVWTPAEASSHRCLVYSKLSRSLDLEELPILDTEFTEHDSVKNISNAEYLTFSLPCLSGR